MGKKQRYVKNVAKDLKEEKSWNNTWKHTMQREKKLKNAQNAKKKYFDKGALRKHELRIHEAGESSGL